MSSGSTPPRADIHALLAHDAFLAALARRMADDAHDGDDIRQETWLAAMRRPPGADCAARAWLGTVARNFCLQNTRSEIRRERRERAAARPESVTPTLDLVAAKSDRAAVAAAVLDLAEPYRTVILLRFFEDLGPTEIAARERIPIETVRTRLKRALRLLRTQLPSPE